MFFNFFVAVLVERFNIQFIFQKPLRIRLKIITLIDERKKVLARLREEDAASFEAVLNKLKIAYTTPPLPEDDPGEARKSWVKHIVSFYLLYFIGVIIT